ncbi:hypothetical protein F4V57_11230 [Acinetobacter qingfengensis]|uniref:Uncharacterized protein n=1 Tax=Acinetobacter qingfengensis TaxID=1262585 RepID=A0A1E7RFM1_9GAMM|nr:hypothetical protein [Acinetobacter qingfengensis]KAA8731815.1 hypothetical protein F4V57_11230 [Acinetobacter qingfengensis]OEY98062.1 hypothetical protein BJI46_00595 [Acinetobacter qingfengensis]
MNIKQQPEMIEIKCDNFGGHAEHWKILTSQPDQDVGLWLHTALDAANFPFGLCQDEQDLPQNIWLLQGPQDTIQITQLIAVKNHKPKHLITAFPVLQSPYRLSAKISRILSCPENCEAVLRLELDNGSVIYGYDALYAVNQKQYQRNISYNIEVNAWAYNLEQVPDKETMLIEDPAAIRHHRALNDILSKNHGETPDDLQDQLAAWQPSCPEDEMPVTLDISKMVAYLYGESIGQEDEAWFQGDIVGKTSSVFMDKKFILYDVAIMREENSQPVILRLAYPEAKNQFKIGQYIRGNIWIQFKIYDKIEN